MNEKRAVITSAGAARGSTSGRRWLALAVLSAAALYTHYFAGVSTLVAVNAVAGWRVMEARRATGRLPLPWLARRLLPPIHGFDLSPIVVMIVIQLMTILLVAPIRDLGRGLAFG